MSDELKSSTPQTPGVEPSVSRSTVPVWIIVLMLLLLFLGMVYFDHHGGWFDSQVYGPYASAEELELYQPKSGAAAVLALGKQKYEQNCGICHGVDGMGKPGQAPPLAGSEWVNAKGFDRLTHIPLAGLNGEIEVKGQQMNFASGMVGIGQAMSDADLAAVLTYIRSSWGNNAGPVTADDVKAIRAKLGSHTQPMSADQMSKMPE
jgi:mono/diheme cytochrome c family protein